MKLLRAAQAIFLAFTLNADIPKVDPFKVTEAVIWFVPWDVQTRTTQSPDQIRSHPYFRLSVHNQTEIEKLIKHLPISNLRPNRERPDDIRLVVDFKLKTGQRITFCASQFYFFSGNQKFRTKPEPQFFKFFDLDKLPLFQ